MAFGLGGALGGLIGGAISSALGGGNKKPSGSSSGSSGSSGSSSRPSGGSSSGGGSSSSSSGGNKNYNTNYSGQNPNYQLTQDEINGLLNEAKQNSQNFATADEAGKQYYHDRNREIYGQLGYDYDEKTGKWTPNAINSAVNQVAQHNTEYKNYQDKMNQAMEAEQAAADAAVEQAIAALDAQKYNVNKVGAAANSAAQDAYMQTVNPNGGLAESLASRGLLSSGLTESSQIEAGNTYQQALNQNALTVAEQLQEIDRAITDARLSGDISKAQALSQYAQQVAQMGMQNAAQIAGIMQWGWSQHQNDLQNKEARQRAIEQWQLQKELIKQDVIAGKISNEEGQKRLNWLDKLLAEEYAGMQKDNAYKDLQYQYAKQNM